MLFYQGFISTSQARRDKAGQVEVRMFLFNVAPMFVERKVRYSASFTFLVGWYAGAVSIPPGDILAQLACHPECHHFLFTSGITNPSLYKHYAAHIRKSRKETKLRFVLRALFFQICIIPLRSHSLVGLLLREMKMPARTSQWL